MRANQRFTAVSVIGLILITIGADAIARSYFENIAVADATRASWQIWVAHPARLALLALPVVGAQLLAVEFARATSLLSGLALLLGTLLMLGLLYFWGHLGFYESMALEKWTAATLAIGLLPIYGTALLIIPLVAAVVAERIKRRRVRGAGE